MGATGRQRIDPPVTRAMLVKGDRHNARACPRAIPAARRRAQGLSRRALSAGPASAGPSHMPARGVLITLMHAWE